MVNPVAWTELSGSGGSLVEVVGHGWSLANEYCRNTIRGSPRRFCRSERENVRGDMYLRRDPRRSAGHLCSRVGDSSASPRRQPSAEQSPGSDVVRRSLRTAQGTRQRLMHPALARVQEEIVEE